MYLIVGLGNPEKQYEKTFHNMGYICAGDAAQILGAKFKKTECEASVAEAYIGGEKVVIARPLTYMNNSGRAVKQLMSKYKIPEERLLVIYDDYDLPKGKLRIRAGGSAGTHNGMRSVVQCVGSEAFPRIRIGVGEAQRGELKDFVLGKPGKAALLTLNEVYARAADAAQLIIAGRINDAQARYNKKHEGL